MITTPKIIIGMNADSATMDKLEELVPRFKEITSNTGKNKSWI